YYEDPQFIGLYDPHPDHGYHRLTALETPLALPPGRVRTLALEHAPEPWRITEWFADVGERVEVGTPVARIVGTVAGQPLEGVLRAPVCGWVAERGSRASDPLVLGGEAMGLLRHYDATQAADLEAMLGEIERDALDLQVDAAVLHYVDRS